MSLKEIMRIHDVGAVSVVESLLTAEKINYLVADFDAEGGAAMVSPSRVLVHDNDFDKALDILISAGFKKDIYPLKQKDTLK